jgi:site-specific recombinase XerD
VTDYLAFLLDHRGLSASTIAEQRRILLRFLAHVGIDGTTDQLRLLSVRQADEFLVEAARGCKRTSMNHLCATIRGFFGFLYMRGILPANLGKQVTTPRIYQQEGVPRAAPWVDVEKTLEIVDRSTLVGRRDYAILSLLAYYGLRALEVATLRLTDLDWRNDVLYVRRGKGGDTDALPLLPHVGEALVGYLKLRPSSEHPEVFMKVIAPSGPMSSASVSWVARKYLLAAGVKAPLLGAHTLRHSFAVRLLRAGFPLKTIGDTLGHRNPQSTFIYAKAATEDLRGIALDIEDVRS